LTPPLKWFGGKHYLASRIVELLPPPPAYGADRQTDERGVSNVDEEGYRKRMRPKADRM
jgi:hypothetical protein